MTSSASQPRHRVRRGLPRGGPQSQDVLVLSGYGLRIVVQRGHLVIEDGIADRRRLRRLSRIERSVKRIAIIGHAGTISLDAIRWLHDVKIPLVHLDTDGRVLAMVVPDNPDHPMLRRTQARAVDSMLGIDIMRDLLRQKLDGQERVLGHLTAGQLAVPQMELGRRALTRANDFIGLRAAEAYAAAAYWAAWSRAPAKFRGSEQDRVPKHWLRFGQRASALTGSPRLAINPANAMLNYLYALLEAEARIALLAVGCDPGVGIQHADQRSRDSLACDVMEAVRPDVDLWLLDYLTKRVLRRKDFIELRNGQCRLMPDLARELAQSSALWTKRLAPVAEKVAQMLYHHATSSPERSRRWTAAAPRRDVRPAKRLPTPLTEKNRQMGRPSRGKVDSEVNGTEATTPLALPALSSGLTKEQFLRRVIPALREIPAAQIAQAVGLSERYCARIRAGGGLPAKPHWEAFRKLLIDHSGRAKPMAVPQDESRLDEH
jgi:CRISPR-associated endonuclease Cas1